jgi:hypothetical protein
MGDGAAFDVDDIVGQSELTRDYDGDRRERLIDLCALNGANLPPGALQRSFDGWDWSKSQHARFDCRDAVRDEARSRLKAVFFGPGLVREHHCGRGVIQSGRSQR